MIEFDVYLKYKAIKIHFSQEKYDFHKYGGKLKNAETIFAYNNFIKRYRGTKNCFMYLSKLPPQDMEGILVSNFIIKDFFIMDIVSDKGKKIFKEWKIRINNIDDNFNKEVKGLILQKIDPTDIETLTTLFIHKIISPETYSILLEIFDRGNMVSKNPVITATYKKLKKYFSFLHKDVDLYRKEIKLLSSELNTLTSTNP